jgi:hypothetical protein
VDQRSRTGAHQEMIGAKSPKEVFWRCNGKGSSYSKKKKKLKSLPTDKENKPKKSEKYKWYSK